MENIQNRTVGSFFTGKELDFNYYGACIMFATWISQRYPDVTLFRTVDDTTLDQYADLAWRGIQAINRVGHNYQENQPQQQQTSRRTG
jgi:hypothetical protein